MKNSILAAILISASMLTLASASQAAIDTETIVNFVSDENETGTIIKPDENGSKEEIIKIPDGKTSSGSLRIQFVPNFRFDEIVGFVNTEQRQNVNLMKYNNEVNVDSGKLIAPFVQVSNNSGLSGTGSGWDLRVNAKPFIGTLAGSENHELTNAQVEFSQSTLTATGGDTVVANKIASGQGKSAISIPIQPAAGISVLKSTGDTNGTQISNVFHDNYKSDSNYNGEKTTSGVQFVKPAGETARKNYQYRSTVTWNLVVGL